MKGFYFPIFIGCCGISNFNVIKVHIFWEGHKICKIYTVGLTVTTYSGDFAKICGLLRIYELYILNVHKVWRNATSYTATLLLPHLKSQTRTPLCFLSSTGAIKTVKRNFSHSYWLSFMLQKTSHSPRWSKCRCSEAFRSMLWNFLYFKYNLVK